MLAADRIVSGRGELPEAVLAEGSPVACAPPKLSLFTSMAFSDSGNLLVAAKADGFLSLREVIITEEAFTRDRPIVSGPPPGEVWLKLALKKTLNIEVGDPFSLARQSSLSVRSSLQSRIVPVAA